MPHARTSSNSRPRRGRPRAFTLVELLLVVVILVVLFGMSIPTFSAMTREQDGRGVMHTVRVSLYDARQRAIDSGLPVRWEVPTANSNPATSRVPATSPTRVATKRASGIESKALLESDGPLVFYPNGTATDARITLMHQGLSIGMIYVVGSTGAIVPRSAES